MYRRVSARQLINRLAGATTITTNGRHIVPKTTIFTGKETSVLNHSLPPTSILNQEKRDFSLGNMSSDSKFQPAKRIHGLEKNVWNEFSALAVKYKSVNLGQGFPDLPAPKHIQEALVETVTSPNALFHQYTRGFGHPRLVLALSRLYGQLLNRPIDPMTELLVTVGAYESLFCIFTGFVEPGDEVIVIEPFFDCYELMVKMAGGIPVFVPLRPNKDGEVTSGDFVLDPLELDSKFSEKTKMIILNTPNNPLGKVFNMSELELIASLCKKYNVLCISDEVYEWMAYNEQGHIRIASLPGMWERTLTVGSAGKTFSVTGWKIGWTYGPEYLLNPCRTVHQNAIYTCSTAIQEAIAIGLEIELGRMETDECYFTQIKKQLISKRERMRKMLLKSGMIPILPEGGYFMMTDIKDMNVDLLQSENQNETKDYQFVKWATKNKKLSMIPVSAFYGSEHKHLAKNYVRLCFLKEESTLDKAEEILVNWGQEAQE